MNECNNVCWSRDRDSCLCNCVMNTGWADKVSVATGEKKEAEEKAAADTQVITRKKKEGLATVCV